MPEEREPMPICKCGYCYEDICVGEEYYEIEEVKYHACCIEDMGVRDVLLRIGVYSYIAETDEE